jgi:hypothetical protein
VKFCLISLLALVARAMVEESSPETVCDLDRHVKIFLNLVEDFDSAIRNDPKVHRVTPLWATVSNFLALLNLPGNMDQFGPLRLMWEGTPKGEDILPKLKPLVTGLTGKWARNSLTRFCHQKAFTFTGENGGIDHDSSSDSSDDDDDEDATVSRERYREYRLLYADSNAILDSYNGGQPLSIVGMADGRFGMVIKGQKRLGVITKEKSIVMLVRGDFIEEVCGASYFYWHCEGSVIHHGNYGWLDQIVHSCLLLPRLDAGGKPEQGRRSYYMITHKWHEMRRDATVGLPWGHACTDDEIPIETQYLP